MKVEGRILEIQLLVAAPGWLAVAQFGERGPEGSRLGHDPNESGRRS